MAFLVTRRRLHGMQPSPWFRTTTYDPSPHKLGPLQRRWRRFQSYPVPRKCTALIGLGVKAIGVFVVLCCAVHVAQSPAIFRSFLPSAEKDYVLDQWDEVEPTLKEGDIILMRGRGPMSWAITTAQYALSRMMHASALRYSHVAVVVVPVQHGVPSSQEHDTNQTLENKKTPAWRWWWRRDTESPTITGSTPARRSQTSVRQTLLEEETSEAKARTVTRGALILEAMDNGEYHVPDVDGQVRYDQVQLVEASKRLFSQTQTGEPAYFYFSVRRLHPCGLTQVNDAPVMTNAQLMPPETDLYGYPEHPSTAAMTSTHATSLATAPYSVMSDADTAVCCGKDTLQPRDVLHQFVSDNRGRPMDASPLYVLSFISPRLYNWLRPEREQHREVSCSELIVELYQRMGLIQRHWRWEPLATEEAQKAVAASVSARASARVEDMLTTHHVLSQAGNEGQSDAAQFPPITRAGKPASRVWESTYCRANLRDERKQDYRLPLVKSDEVVEGPVELVAGDHETFLCAPAKGVACTVPLDVVLSGQLVGAVTVPQTSARQGGQLITDAEAPLAQVLHAGLVRRDASGKLHQLRWFYRHASVQTSPYQFTDAGDRSTLDWRHPFKLGHEEFVEMPSQRFAFKDMRNTETP